MVNIAQYQIVAIGDTLNECEKTYLNLMKSSGIGVAADTSKLTKITGTIKKIADCVVDGNTHYYILLDNSGMIFDVPVNDFVKVIKYNVGDTITLSYSAGTDFGTVLGIE